MRVPRFASSVAAALLLVSTALGSGRAEAAPALAEQCASASERAQLARLEGKLTTARADLVTCSAAGCPSVVRKDCDRWLTEIDDALPSAVITVRDANGADVVEARVMIDGVRALDRVEPRAIPLDPGTHEIEIVAADGATAKRSIVLREGEKRRPLEIVLPRPAEPAPVVPKPAPKSSLNVPRLAGWSLVGLAGAGLVTGIVFGVRQHVLYQDAEGSCAPSCGADVTDPIDQARLFEGIAFGAGAIALTAGLILLFTHPKDPGSALRLDLTRIHF